MRRHPRSVVITVVFALVIVSTACPSANDLDRAAKASNELAHDCLTANRVIAEFYTAGRLSLAVKDKLADRLGVLCTKGESFNNLLIDLDKKYPQGTLPPQDLSFVRENLSELRRLYDEVVASLLPFKAQQAVGEFGKDLTTIEKVVHQ